MSIKNPSTLFFLIATTLVLGIFLGATFGLSLLFFVLAFSSSLLCAFVLFLLGSKHIFLTVILAFISCIVGNLRYQMVLGQYDTSIPKKTITGQIISNPQDKSYGQSFVFITSKNQKVLVQNRGQELFEYDDKATLQVICSRPKNFETDLGGTFDYVRYLKKDHIYAQCQFEKGTVHTRQPRGRVVLPRVRGDDGRGKGSLPAGAQDHVPRQG
jgi:predicted membrane metal-binding protein